MAYTVAPEEAALHTVELQWLEQLWNHVNMFEKGVARANECDSLPQVRGTNWVIFSIFFNMKVCCVFSLESPHRGDSNENTQYTIFNIEKKISLIYPESAAMTSHEYSCHWRSTVITRLIWIYTLCSLFFELFK